MKAFTKLSLMMVVGFIVSVSLFAILINPEIGKVKALFAEATDKLTQAQVLAQQITAYKNSQTDLDAVADQNDILNRILQRDNLQAAVAEVESAAGKTDIQEGMTITDADATAAGASQVEAEQVTNHNAEIEEVPYTVSASGSFPSLIKFLQYLEHLPNFTEVSSIQIDAATSTAAPITPTSLTLHGDTITSEINGVFFIKKDKTQSP